MEAHVIAESVRLLGDLSNGGNAILADWRNGVEFVMAELAQKVQCWSTLPWKLCGLAHPSPESAQACAAQCLE
eukprot:10717427-Alexandrium_andersonii.AAC.1